eukprot:TCONS_00057496-protein
MNQVTKRTNKLKSTNLSNLVATANWTARNSQKTNELNCTFGTLTITIKKYGFTITLLQWNQPEDMLTQTKEEHESIGFPDASGEQKFVCKDMFISTLGYRFDKFISTALSTTSNFGVTLQDKRGKHPPKHAMSDSGKQTAIQHVMSFNPQISHYRREHAPNRLYLPSELTIQEMYEDYLDQRKENNENTMSYVQYTRIVKSQNISFAKLGDDECEMCESHKLHLRDVKQKDTSTSDDRLETRIFNAKRIDKDKDMSCGKGDCLACVVWLDHQTKY